MVSRRKKKAASPGLKNAFPISRDVFSMTPPPARGNFQRSNCSISAAARHDAMALLRGNKKKGGRRSRGNIPRRKRRTRSANFDPPPRERHDRTEYRVPEARETKRERERERPGSVSRSVGVTLSDGDSIMADFLALKLTNTCFYKSYVFGNAEDMFRARVHYTTLKSLFIRLSSSASIHSIRIQSRDGVCHPIFENLKVYGV